MFLTEVNQNEDEVEYEDEDDVEEELDDPEEDAEEADYWVFEDDEGDFDLFLDVPSPVPAAATPAELPHQIVEEVELPHLIVEEAIHGVSPASKIPEVTETPLVLPSTSAAAPKTYPKWKFRKIHKMRERQRAKRRAQASELATSGPVDAHGM